MKLLRGAAAVGIAKKLYNEAQKPENKRKIQDAVGKVKSKRKPGRRG